MIKSLLRRDLSEATMCGCGCGCASSSLPGDDYRLVQVMEQGGTRQRRRSVHNVRVSVGPGKGWDGGKSSANIETAHADLAIARNYCEAKMTMTDFLSHLHQHSFCSRQNGGGPRSTCIKTQHTRGNKH